MKPENREHEEDDGPFARIGDVFGSAARLTAHGLGTPWAFMGALGLVILWAAAGPATGFSTAWQLIINTGTTIVTFLMVFLIQNTQNRDSQALHLKVDELLRVTVDARTDYVDLEDLSEAELRRLQERFKELSERAAEEIEEDDAEGAADDQRNGPVAVNGRSGRERDSRPQR